MHGSQLLIDSTTEDECYNAGWQSVENGLNTTNCHFRFFGKRENTRAWERGAADAHQAIADAKEIPIISGSIEK